MKQSKIYVFFAMLVLCGAALLLTGCPSSVISAGGTDTVLPGTKNFRPRSVSNTNPLFIASVYATNLEGEYDHLDPENVKYFEGHQTPKMLWDMVPESLKPYTVIQIHANSVGGTGNNSDIAKVKQFYDDQLAITDKYGIPAAIVVLAAYSGNNGQQYYAFNGIDPRRPDDAAWVKELTAAHPSLTAFVSTEHYWTITPSGVSAGWLKAAAENDALFIIHDGYNYNGYFHSGSEFTQAVEQYGSKALAMTFKYTNPTNIVRTMSYSVGMWLNGQNYAWGGLIDTWSWYERGFSKLFGPNIGKSQANKQVAMYPEGLLAIYLMNMYMNGATVFNFEAPWVVYGNTGETSAMMEHVIAPFFEYMVKNPAPSREQMLKKTKFILHPASESNYQSLYPPNTIVGTGTETYKTGRYGMVPIIPPALSPNPAKLGSSVTVAASKTAAEWEAAYPQVTETLGSGKTEGFAASYTDPQGKQNWYFYNYEVNPTVGDNALQYAKVNLGNGKTLEVKMTPHTVIAVKKVSEGRLEVWMTNYRLDKDSMMDESFGGAEFSIAARQQRDSWIVENICVNPKDSRWRRETVFTIGNSAASGRIISNQTGSELSVVNQGGTVTVNGNCWLQMEITY